MPNSGFINEETQTSTIEKLDPQGGTSEAFIVKTEGKNLFMKRLRPEFANNPKYRTIFEKEYELGKSLDSPYIPQYISLNKDKDGLYIIMEYIYGDNIEEKLESDPEYFQNEKNIYKLLMQLLKGLEELHSKDILYLDFNPKNIMLTKFGNNVKITDLGFCANAAYHHTAGSTEGFSAPEVEEKKLEELDSRSDIFSVGLLLKHIKERSGAKFPRRLNSFMQRCLKKDKKERFANVKDAIVFLNRSSRWRYAAFAVVISAFVIFSLFAFINSPKTESDQDKTGREEVTSTTFNGVEYRIMSHNEKTCMVTGGKGKGNNIYIEPQIKIGDNTYRTVAIMDSAFARRDILSVHIPEGVEVIGRGAFFECSSIVTINLPNSIKKFSGAFVDMKGLNRVKLPASKEISTTSFVGDTAIKDIFVPEGVERICLDAFVSCESLRNVSLPQTLKVIERGAFFNCKELEEIVIPSGVQEIGEYAFFYCSSLYTILCHATVPPRITTIINSPVIDIYVPDEAVEAYKKDFNWNYYNILPMSEYATREEILIE